MLPVTQAEDPSLRSQALDKLRLITDRIMLRRIKRDHTESMELPPKEVVIHNEVRLARSLLFIAHLDQY